MVDCTRYEARKRQRYQTLVERAIEGDRDSLNAPVGRYQSVVFNVAMKMFGSRADAEDLTQEIFIRVITSLRTFRAESAFATWLYRITVNHLLKTRRKGVGAGYWRL